MNAAVTLAITAILAWAVHIVIYVRYAVAFHPHLRTRAFIAGHSLETSLVFGLLFTFGLWVAHSPGLQDIVVAAGALLVLDIVTYALARDFFRPLMSPMNALLPPVCASATVLGIFMLMS